MSLRTLITISMLLTLAACGAQPSATSAVVNVGNLQISDVWARPAQVIGGAMDVNLTPMATDMAMPTDAAMASEMSAAVSGAYMTIKNTGSTADKLLKVQGDVAASVELHTMTESNGVMQMRPVESVEIPANAEVQLKPGSFHVMLIGLKRELKAGDTIPFTLQFERAGTIQVTATVRDPK